MPMNTSPELRPRAADFVLAAFILLCAGALAVLFYRGAGAEGSVAVVRAEGVVCARLPLHTDADYTCASLGYTLRVRVSDGRVRVIDADCPNRDCVRSAAISRPGQSIVCLPARVTVSVEGAAADYDIVAG